MIRFSNILKNELELENMYEVSMNRFQQLNSFLIISGYEQEFIKRKMINNFFIKYYKNSQLFFLIHHLVLF